MFASSANIALGKSINFKKKAFNAPILFRKAELYDVLKNNSTAILFTDSVDDADESYHQENILIEDWRHFTGEIIHHSLLQGCRNGRIHLTSPSSLLVDIPSKEMDYTDTSQKLHYSTTTPTTNKHTEICRNIGIALFVVQLSSDAKTFTDIKKRAVLDIISAINLQQAKVGIIAYASTAQTVVDIGNYATTNELNTLVKNIPYIGAGDNGLSSAINTAADMVQENRKTEKKLQNTTLILIHDSTTR